MSAETGNAYISETMKGTKGVQVTEEKEIQVLQVLEAVLAIPEWWACLECSVNFGGARHFCPKIYA